MALTNLNIEVTQMAVGYGHYLAIGTDGALYSWGLNNHGQLGHGDKVNRSNPTKVGNKTDWTQIACGDYHSVALDSRGIAYGFGFNNNAQAGVGQYVGNSHTGIGGTNSTSDIIFPTQGFSTSSNSDLSTMNGTDYGGAALIKAAANYTVIDYIFPGGNAFTTSFSLGGTWVYGNSFVFDEIDNLTAGPNAIYSERRHIANLRDGSDSDSGRIGGYATKVLRNISKCEISRNFIAVTTGTSGIDCLGNLPLSMVTKPTITAPNGAAGDKKAIADNEWDSGSGPRKGLFGVGPQYGVDTVQNFMTVRTQGWERLRRAEGSVNANNFSGPVDNTNYIDFGVGDDFILAIDSENRLHGMTFATSNGTEIPSTSVGNFGVQVLRNNLINPNNRYVIHGMVLIDSSRRWLSVSCGAKHAIISDVDGNIFSIGNNRYGQLGRAYNNLGNITEIAQLQSPANTSGFNIHACGPQASLIAKS